MSQVMDSELEALIDEAWMRHGRYSSRDSFTNAVMHVLDGIIASDPEWDTTELRESLEQVGGITKELAETLRKIGVSASARALLAPVSAQRTTEKGTE